MRSPKIISFILLFSLLLSSCSKEGKYTDSIPRQVDLLLQVDAQSLFQESIPESSSPILQSAVNSGIDWTQKAYAFLEGNTVGLVAAVNDADALSSFLQSDAVKAEIDADGDYTWATSDLFLVGYTEDCAVALSYYGDAKLFRQRVRKLLEQDASDSFSSQPAFQQLQASDSHLAAYASAAALPEELIGKWLSFLPKDVELSDLAALLKADFQTGQIQLGAELVSQDPRVQKGIEELSAHLQKVDGVYADSIPAQATAFVSFHATPDLLNYLKQANRQIGIALELLEQDPEGKDFLNQANGDVGVSVLGNSDLVLQNQGRNLVVNSTGVSALGTSFLSSFRSAQNERGEGYLYAILDLPRLYPSPWTAPLDKVCLSWTAPTRVEATVTLQNREQNALKTLLEAWMR